MSKMDQTYHQLLNTILTDGFKYKDPNRKGINRIQIPSYQIKHDFKDGFPAITTKKLYWKGVVAELLWFLKGDTNIKYLVDNGINIWNKDSYNYYLKQNNNKFTNLTFEHFVEAIKNYNEDQLKNWLGTKYTLGDLGPVYGAQWRNWFEYGEHEDDGNFYQYEGIDQISNLIKGLKETPMGTQHIVTAWNPAELNNMALPPCHWSFEILVEPIKYIMGADFIKYSNSPKYQFTLKWHQRSVDTFLGLPFNIASYALLAQIIGKMTNMIPKGIIGDLSNVHIYEPHMDAIKEQLSRDVDKYSGCELEIWKKDKELMLSSDRFTLNDKLNNLEIHNFKLKDYKSYPRIPAEMLAYNK